MAICFEFNMKRPFKMVELPSSGQSHLAGATTDEEPLSEEAKTEQKLQQQLDSEIAKLRKTRMALEQAANELKQQKQEFLEHAEQQVLALSLEIARKVLAQEIQAGRYEITPIVRDALSQIPVQIEAVVHLNPADLERCELAREETENPAAASVHFIGDPSVSLGGCLVMTSQGFVSSSVEEHLSEIAQTLHIQD